MSVPSSAPTERPVDRARGYTAGGVVMAVGTIYFLFGNVFLVPVCGLIAMFCAWRGWRNGAPVPLMLVVFAIGALPALFAGIALISLIPNLPSLRFGHIHYQHD